MIVKSTATAWRFAPHRPAERLVLLHPHANCPMCGGALTGDEQLSALIAAMRTSAQDTLAALHKSGYAISKQGATA